MVPEVLLEVVPVTLTLSPTIKPSAINEPEEQVIVVLIAEIVVAEDNGPSSARKSEATVTVRVPATTADKVK